MRNNLEVFGTGMVLAIFAGGAAAESPRLDQAYGSVSLDCVYNESGAGQSTGFSFGCDKTVSSGGATATGIARGMVSLTRIPQGEAVSHAQSTGSRSGDYNRGTFAYSVARTWIDYEVGVAQIAAPPIEVLVPVLVRARGDVTASMPEVHRHVYTDPDGDTYVESLARSSSSGYVEVNLSSLGLWEPLVARSEGGHAALEYRGAFDMMPGESHQITMLAVCRSEAQVMDRTVWGFLGTVSSECQAVVDPILSFDQATFDTRMGVDTFSLARYYQIAYSANLVPEPATWMSMAGGLLAVLAALRRKREISTVPAASWF